MTNNLKEIERIITWRERLVLDDKDSAFQKGLDIKKAEEEAIEEMSHLINQKEKEARIDEIRHLSGYREDDDWYGAYIDMDSEDIRDRIKQLKEELNREGK